MELPFSNFFKKPDTSVLGLDIGSSSIKVVQLKKKGNKAVLETYGELSLGPYAGVSIGQATKLDADKIAEAMISFLNEKEVAITTRNCGVAIPFHASLLKVISMPKVDEKDLVSMVPIEARKYIPVPISEVSLDWSIIPKLEVKQDLEPYEKENKDPNKTADTNKVETLDLLIAAIHNNIIAEYNKIIETSGLKAGFFEIELFSSMRSVLDNTTHSAMIIDMGAASTKLYIVERGILRSSHIINRGSQDITANIARINSISFEDAEIIKRNIGTASGGEVDTADAVSSASEYIFSEANRVLFSYQSLTKINIEKVILIGGGASLKGIKEIASEYLKTEVISGDPFGKTETPAFLEDILRETGPTFAVCVGVALRKLSEL